MNKINVGYATVAKKVDVKRLKRDLWTELERALVTKKEKMETREDGDNEEDTTAGSAKSFSNDSDEHGSNDENFEVETREPLSFQSVVSDMQKSQVQGDVTLPFYFICVLHLANEQNLAFESCGLNDFIINM